MQGTSERWSWLELGLPLGRRWWKSFWQRTRVLQHIMGEKGRVILM